MANERPPMRMMGRGGPPPHERMLMAEIKEHKRHTEKACRLYRKEQMPYDTAFIRYADNHCAEPCCSLSLGLAIDKITVSNQRLNVDISGML